MTIPETNWTWNDFWGAGWVNWHWSWNSTQQWGEVTRLLDMLRFSPLLPKTHSDQQFPPASSHRGTNLNLFHLHLEAGFWGWAVATDVHVSSVSRWVYRRMFCACVMVSKRAASDSIRDCAAQSWDYLSPGRASAAVLSALCCSRGRFL